MAIFGSRSVRALLAGAAAVTVLATAACGGGSRASDQEAGGPPEREEPVQLEVTWWGGPARAEITQKVLDLYTQKHPNVTFTTQWQGYSGYYDKVNTTAAGRNAADIIQIDNRVLREYANKELIAPLDAWVGGTLQVDGIDPKLLDTGKVDGTLYAVPLAANTGSFVVDKTVVEPLGLLPPETGWASWEEFGSWAAQVNQATGGAPWAFRDESSTMGAFEFWLRQRGKELYNGQAPGFTVEDVTQWFEMWAGFRQSGAASPAEVAQPANGGDISKNTVITQQTAGTFSYDNQLTEIAKGTDHELVLMPLPGPQTGAYARPSQFFTAYAQGDNVATAVDVINFFVSDPEAGAILGTERGLPPSKQVRDTISPAFDEQLKYVLEFDERVTAQAGPTPPVPAQGDSQITRLLTAASENVGFGRQSPADAAAEFVAQVTGELERAAS
ncbi:ABC transporter substrate-binding protein [Pseudonocardia zijingensis]|jgi:multiple sugar transport system substrate-binding protein|uniref:ABC transporter substrate-binding protein n=1 Tax=Pseudonocardia zijingensis TaxID=153376 RepID=A0ABN1QES8_9PSEU